MSNEKDLQTRVNRAFMSGGLSKLGLQNAKSAIKSGKTEHLEMVLKGIEDRQPEAQSV